MGKKNFSKGFADAFEQLPIRDKAEATKELMAILGIRNRASWIKYKRGDIIPPADKAQDIENFFHKKGVKNVYG